MIIEYFDYTQADAKNDGIGFTISRYSKKVVIDNSSCVTWLAYTLLYCFAHFRNIRSIPLRKSCARFAACCVV